MQTDFERETRGFAMAEVDDAKRWFHFENPPGVGVWPLPYTQLGLPKDCTRLVVLSLVDAPAVAAAGAACAREMVKLLGPCGAACFTVCWCRPPRHRLLHRLLVRLTVCW